MNSEFFYFDAHTTDFHPGNAYWLCFCAAHIYDEEPVIKKTILEKGMDRFNFISNDTTQCIVVSNDQVVIIAFRGTEKTQREDIATDLELEQVTDFGGQVHKGFAKAYGLIQDELKSVLSLHQTEEHTIWITGHSLGGALACLCGYDLEEDGIPVQGIYTFGQPRVGNPQFCTGFDNRLKNKHFRIVHKDDRIPTFPFDRIKVKKQYFEYVDMGQPLFIIKDMLLVKEYIRSENSINQVASAVNAFPSHNKDNYLKAMEKNLDRDPFTMAPLSIVEDPIYTIDDLAQDKQELIRKSGIKVEELKKNASKLEAILKDSINTARQNTNVQIKLEKFLNFKRSSKDE